MSFKNKLNKILRKFNVELHGLGYLQSLSKGEFKKNEFDYFSNLFNNQHLVIFDVGANRGHTVQRFLDLFTSSKIFAFEPYPTLATEIKNRYAENLQVKVEEVGISNSRNQLQFYVNRSIDTSSLLASRKIGLNSDTQVENVKTITVPVKTIEDVFQENGLERINILKLDIQGSELNALKGAKNLLEAKKIDLIYTEAYFVQQYVNQPLFHEIADYLLRHGYLLQDIYNPIYGNGKLAWCDAVFIREGI
ncbi:MAG: FkbM family methyltransferase [Ferruginibacter sp.]